MQGGVSRQREMGGDITVDAVQGASSSIANETVISDNDRRNMMEQMGAPTDRMSDGSHISTLQAQKRSASGHRGYKIQQSSDNAQNRLQMRSGGSSSARDASLGQQAGRVSEERQGSASTPDKGVSVKRTKKRLRKAALKGTPATQDASQEILYDLAQDQTNASTDLIHDKTEESESESDSDSEAEKATPSQSVAAQAIHLKKLEQNRRKSA